MFCDTPRPHDCGAGAADRSLAPSPMPAVQHVGRRERADRRCWSTFTPVLHVDVLTPEDRVAERVQLGLPAALDPPEVAACRRCRLEPAACGAERPQPAFLLSAGRSRPTRRGRSERAASCRWPGTSCSSRRAESCRSARRIGSSPVDGCSRAGRAERRDPDRCSPSSRRRPRRGTCRSPRHSAEPRPRRRPCPSSPRTGSPKTSSGPGRTARCTSRRPVGLGVVERQRAVAVVDPGRRLPGAAAETGVAGGAGAAQEEAAVGEAGPFGPEKPSGLTRLIDEVPVAASTSRPTVSVP